MRRLRSWLVVLVAGLGLLGGLLVAPAQAAGQTTLVAVRTGHHTGFDRIVFDFDGPLPSRPTARWVDQVRFDGSGTPMNLHGNAFIRVQFGAVTQTPAGRLSYRDPVRAIGLPNLNHMVSNGDFEAHVTIGLGLMQRTRILRTFTLRNPSRYVVDVSTDFTQAWARVFFVDEDRAAIGQEPVVRHVLRRVPVPAVARGQLHRFYAGPTPAEKRDGLMLVTSIVPPRNTEVRDRTGFRNLRVSDRVAFVTLTGRCSSGGSTITVANEMQPMLRFWPTVDFVKIFDSAGQTAEPAGRSDSIPECLEP